MRSVASRRRRPTAALAAGTRHLFLFGFLVFFAVPLLWMVLAVTKTDQELRERHPLSFGTLSEIPSVWSDLMAFSDGIVFDWWLRSFLYAGLALFITLTTTIPAGYALGTMRFPGRKVILWITLMALLIPASATVLPIFLTASAVSLVGSTWSVVLPMAFFPFGVYLTYIHFATSVPHSLLAAARLDGASEWTVFARIALPHARPMIGLVAFLSFTANWNRFFLPFVMLNSDDSYSLPVGLPVLIQSSGAFQPVFGANLQTVNRPEIAMAGLMLIVPVAAIFLVSQRYVTRGAFAGGVKG